MAKSRKVALLADPQFDEQLSLSHFTPEGISSRLADQLAALRWVASSAHDRGCEELLVLGDIFDSRTTLNLSVIDQVCRGFHDAHTEHGLALTFLVGNHDAYLRCAALNSLQMFRGYAEVIDKPCYRGEFAFIPWAEDLDAIKKAVDYLVDESDASYLFMHGILHGAVHKSVAGIPLELIKPKHWKRVWLGDVHEPCDMAPNVHYVGSFMQHHFGDAGGFRGYVILDTATGKFERLENPVSPRFHIIKEGNPGPTSFGFKDFVSVELDDAADSKAIAEQFAGKVAWLRNKTIEIPETAPRLDIHSSQDYSDILKSYCTHQNVDDPDLTALGLTFIEQAKQGSA